MESKGNFFSEFVPQCMDYHVVTLYIDLWNVIHVHALPHHISAVVVKIDRKRNTSLSLQQRPSLFSHSTERERERERGKPSDK
jgi:hypothetical protein